MKDGRGVKESGVSPVEVYRCGDGSTRTGGTSGESRGGRVILVTGACFSSEQGYFGGKCDARCQTVDPDSDPSWSSSAFFYDQGVGPVVGVTVRTRRTGSRSRSGVGKGYTTRSPPPPSVASGEVHLTWKLGRGVPGSRKDCP